MTSDAVVGLLRDAVTRDIRDATEPIYDQLRELQASRDTLLVEIAELRAMHATPEVVPPAAVAEVEEEIIDVVDGEDAGSGDGEDGSDEIPDAVEEEIERIEERIADVVDGDDVRPVREHFLNRAFMRRD